ncbi:hypothetical protein HCJ93_27435 [Streptomyces sp. SBST2-5]|uniref:Lipoprotein n=1 Tax=Streptomyces composti TaxID=2720025 RepID=A0ABX1AEK4_9ACTN|nr:hypothetical protein [Streptomyces composti]
MLIASAVLPAVAATGCTGGSGKSGAGERRPESAEERARARAARESAELVERYDAVIAAHPKLAGRLGLLRADVVRQEAAFGGGAGKHASPSATAPASGSPSASASVSGSAPASASGPVSGSPSEEAVVAASPSGVPGDEKEALAQLARAERELADRRAEGLVEAPGELARLLASVAAAGAARAYLLTKA